MDKQLSKKLSVFVCTGIASTSEDYGTNYFMSRVVIVLNQENKASLIPQAIKDLKDGTINRSLIMGLVLTSLGIDKGEKLDETLVDEGLSK